VWWEDGADVHAAFVSVPDGAVTDAGILPPAPQAGGTQLGGPYGGTYTSATRSWLRVSRLMLSPDGKQYVYWTATPSLAQVRVVDIATGADRAVYSGTTYYIVIAFEPDAIYLVHALNPRQGSFDNLYRLDPAGGTPTLVAGSDRHMDQYGWVLVSDGAAWGIGARVASGTDYVYSVLRLDLATVQVTEWFEGPVGTLVWPLGTDTNHKLYVQGIIPNQNQNDLWRFAAAGQAEQLANPGPISLGDNAGGTTIFVSDSVGVWFAGRGRVWLYSDGAAPRQFVVGLQTTDVFPAGPCV
jgi:hypothetical protein